MISEKSVPNNINILKRTYILFLVIIYVLAGVDLAYKLMEESDINEVN